MSQRESRLSRAIMQALRDHGAFVWKNHGGPTMMSGLPDIVGVYRGYMIAVETKNPDGHPPTPIQTLRHDQMRACGARVVVAHNVAEGLSVLWGIEPPGVNSKPSAATSGPRKQQRPGTPPTGTRSRS